MADIFTRKKRSAVLSAIRSHGNAATELRLLALFRSHRITGWRRGLTLRGPAPRGSVRPFRVKPDFVFPKLAVFVDGCFWPGCPLHATQPKTHATFWRENVARQRGDGHDAGVAP